MIFDARRCELGEGPLWHPERKQLFWFDILGHKMMSQDQGGAKEWAFSECVSAAGWVSSDTFLIATETALCLFDLTTGSRKPICDLEADMPQTRSNDGRADPQGGFWIGTMGKNAEAGAGTIYRFYRGELRALFRNISISNAICFAPDGRSACFTDTPTGQVMRVGLDAQGWPVGTPEVYLDLRAEGLNPDGAVIDAQGVIWLAQWGAARVAAYAPDGSFLRAVEFDAPHTSCPAFGGPDGSSLYCTTALAGMSPEDRAARPHSGKVFVAHGVAQGQAEHRVIMSSDAA